MPTSTAISDLKRMTLSELAREIKLKRVECAKMRMGLEMQKEKNHAMYRGMKRDIARMCMVLDEMEKIEKSQMKAKNQSGKNPTSALGATAGRQESRMKNEEKVSSESSESSASSESSDKKASQMKKKSVKGSRSSAARKAG